MSTDTKTLITVADGRRVYTTEGTGRLLDALAKSLGYTNRRDLTVIKGGWVGASSQSGNTHGREALDLSDNRWRDKVWNARRLGLWLDHRTIADGGGSWDEPHCHGARLAPGAGFLHPSMTGQQLEYLAGGDGLVGSKRDDDRRPRYPNVRFVDDRVHQRWTATKATKGYHQAGGHKDDARVNRPKGWTWGSENIATVRVDGVEWLVTKSMTFYRKADFVVYRPATVAPPATATPRPAAPAKAPATAPTVPPLLFTTKAYSWNVNGKAAHTMRRRAKVIGAEVATAHPSILFMQECYVGVRGLIKAQLPDYLHFVGAHMGKALWIDPDVWSFKQANVRRFALGNGKNGMSALLTHRATGFDQVASTAHLVVGAKRSADRMAEAKRWGELTVKHYGDTPALLAADWNDERIKDGGPRRELILRHGYHAPESDVGVGNIVHGATDSYNGYKATPPANGEHIDGFLLTRQLFATRARIDKHNAPQGADHYGVEVTYGPRA